jgi:Cdc25 family phosphatase
MLLLLLLLLHIACTQPRHPHWFWQNHLFCPSLLADPPNCAAQQDFVGGHIKGAINLEAEHFADDAAVDQLIDNALADKSRVVVHCMLSQQRGPRCAARLAQRLQDRGLQQPSVLVMSGGFSRFDRMYGDNADLVDKGAAQQ